MPLWHETNATIPHAKILEGTDFIDAAGPRASDMTVLDCGPTGEGWSFYNVLLIERRNDDIASKVGLGKVHRKALNHALPPGPQWTEIYLG